MSRSDHIALDMKLSRLIVTTTSYARYVSDCAKCPAPPELCTHCVHLDQRTRQEKLVKEIRQEIMDEFAPEEEA